MGRSWQTSGYLSLFFFSVCVLFTCVYHSVYQSTWIERPYSLNQILFYYYFNMILKISHMYTMYHDYVHLYSSPQLPSQLHLPSNIIPSFLIKQLISPLSSISNMTIPQSKAKKFPSKAMIFPWVLPLFIAPDKFPLQSSPQI